MGSSPSTCSVVSKQEAIVLLKQAEQIDHYTEECADDWSNFIARKDYSYAPNQVKKIYEYTVAFNQLIKKVPKQLQDIGEVKILCLMPTADGGMPHTRPPNLICYAGLSLSQTTFTHELCHLHQRKFPKMWSIVFQSLGWTPWNGMLPSSLESHRRYNPDTIDSPLWRIKSWVPVPIFRNVMNPVLNEVDIWFYHVDGYHVKAVPEEIAVEMLPSSAYEHPREMTAYIISEPEKYSGTAVYKVLRTYIDI
jgi:hypothetical protein